MILDFVKQLNLKEIQYLSDKLSISYDNNNFKFSKDISNQDIFDASKFIKNEIWNQTNVQSPIATIKKEQAKKFFITIHLPNQSQLIIF